MTRHRPHRLVAAAMALTLAVAAGACGDDDDAQTTPTAPPTEAPAATTPPQSEGSDGAAITIAGFDFGDPITVTVGETVTVTNTDSAPHTWTSTEGAFDSGPLTLDESYEHVFDEPGTYPFVCSFHPTMTGSVTVS